MKVLQLNVNGISGSTGKIVTDIKKVLEADGQECLVCYGANDNIKGKGYHRICPEFERRVNAAISRATGILHGNFLPFSLWRFKKIVEDWKPDVVHIHCPNGYIIDIFKLLEYLANKKQKTILTNHAEYFYTGGCGYAFDCLKWLEGCSQCSTIKGFLPVDSSAVEWNSFKKAFDMFERENLIVTSVSPWTRDRAIQSQALRRFENVVTMNGVDTDIFHKRKISNDVEHRLPKGKPIVLHVTASFSTDKDFLKGGYWIRELANRMPHVNFVVACTFKGSISGLPENAFIWGRTNGQIELAELYNAAKVTVITSKKETFSMIVAESLCCGTPVVGFEAGGPETIALEKYSTFVKYGNLDALVNAIETELDRKNNNAEISEVAQNIYSKEKMAKSYIKLYNDIVS